MLYAVDGVALGGWQLVDLALMALVAIELLSLIFLKVVIILLGALLYATGPITIGLVATESGAAIARAWASAVVMLIALPVAWATLFAVGALLVGDAGTAGPLIAGHSSVGSLLGGVLLAVAGAASLWMCLRAAREAMGLLADAARRAARAQPPRLGGRRTRGGDGAVELGGLAAALRRAGRAGGRRRRRRARGRRRRRRGGRARRPRGRLRRAARRARHRRRGRPSGGGVSRAARAAALVGRSRAGAVAVRMAKAGTAGWHASPNGDAARTRRRRSREPARTRAGARSSRGVRPTAKAIARPAAGARRRSATAATREAEPRLASDLDRRIAGPADASSDATGRGQAAQR